MTLLETQTRLKANIDRIAESVRLQYITGGNGQAMTYLDKSDEAADYKAASYPADLTIYPFIQAEVNATGKTNQDAADDILTERSNWIAKASTIEEERLKGKKAVDDAGDEDTAKDARSTACVALQAL